MTQFLELVYPLKVQEGGDTLLWKDDRRENFNIKSYYKSLSTENNLVFLAKEIWGSRAPLRMCVCVCVFFLCLGSSLGKILTIGMFGEYLMCSQKCQALINVSYLNVKKSDCLKEKVLYGIVFSCGVALCCIVQDIPCTTNHAIKVMMRLLNS